MPRARTLRLSTGFKVPLDGDLLAIIEALYQEITLANVLNPSFERMRSEILALIEQMSPAERQAYLAESLFLNSVTYENEMLSAYVRRLATKSKVAPKPAGKKPGAARRRASRLR